MGVNFEKMSTRFLFVIFFALAVAARASTVLSDNFESYTAGNLIGQGGWTKITSGATTEPMVTDVDINDDTNHGVYLGGSFDSPTYSGDDAFKAFSKAVTYIIGGSIEMDFQLYVSEVQTGAIFAGFGPSASASNNTIYGALFARDDGDVGFYLGIGDMGLNNASSTGTYSDISLDTDTSYDISLVWHFAGGQNKDTFDLYVDSELYLSTLWTSSSATPAQLASVILRQGGAATAPVLFMDDLVVSNPALIVPEPASILLLAVGIVFIFMRRRLCIM